MKQSKQKRATKKNPRSLRKRIFLQCTSGFFILILLLSAAFFTAQTIYSQRLRDTLCAQSQQQFDTSVSALDHYLDQLKYTYAEIVSDPSFLSVVDGSCGANYNYASVVKTMRTIAYGRKQNEFIPYLDSLYLLMPTSNPIVVGSEGTCERADFFASHFRSEQYPEEFWSSEMAKDFTFQLYVPAAFHAADGAAAGAVLMPIAYKLPANKNFLLLSTFNLNSAVNDLLPAQAGQLVITNQNGVLYSSDPVDDALITTIENANDPVTLNADRYIYRRDSSLGTLCYYYIIPSSAVFSPANRLIWTMFLVGVLVTLLSVLFAVFASRRVCKDACRITQKLSDCVVCEEGEDAAFSGYLFDYLDAGISALVEKNRGYAGMISEKDSLLRTVFLQSRVRDIYVSIEDAEKQLSIAQAYVMIYMRVHYKDAFYESIQEEQGKATFFLKQLIELYFSATKDDCVTFQIETDQIVSIINTAARDEVMNLAQAAIKKLENESDYVFFTVVISDVHQDVSALKTNFDHLAELSKYALPVMETQVLVEGEVKQGAGRFYFTVEQMERLSSLMQNESLDECLRNLNEIFDYNIKKEVNGFDLYLLCTEIVSCAVKLLNRLFHATPASLGISQVYAKLDRAVTVQQYQKICAQLVERVVEYIRINKREEDYIISFILDYVENHYAEDIYLNLFAEKLKLTAAYISSYFKEKMSVNLSDYVNSFRIKKAIALMENSQNKNKDIAAMVGLQNINTFIRLFKKYTGYTPGEYKKKHYGDNGAS